MVREGLWDVSSPLFQRHGKADRDHEKKRERRYGRRVRNSGKGRWGGNRLKEGIKLKGKSKDLDLKQRKAYKESRCTIDYPEKGNRVERGEGLNFGKKRGGDNKVTL